MIYLIYLLLLVGLIIDFKRTVLIFAPFKILILNSVRLFGADYGFEEVFSLTVFIFFIVNNNYRNNRTEKFPLLIAFILLGISQSISISIDGLHLKSILFEFVRTYGYVYIMFCLIKNKEDIKLILNSTFIFILLIILNAGIEYITQQQVNILGQFMKDNAPSGYFSSDSYTRGMRIRSFMPHSIGFGNVCAIFLFLYLFLCSTIKYKIEYIIIVIFLFIGIILTLSRTPILATLCYLVPMYINKNLINKRGLYILLLTGVAYYYSFDYVSEMLNSIFDDSDEMNGSSLELRLIQLDTCFKIIRENPFFGIGIGFELSNYPALMGAESVWYNLLCIQGYFGVICYVYLFYSILRYSMNNIYFKYIVFLSLGYFVAQSATYNAGIDDFMFLMIFIIIYKMGQYDVQLNKSTRQC